MRWVLLCGLVLVTAHHVCAFLIHDSHDGSDHDGYGDYDHHNSFESLLAQSHINWGLDKYICHEILQFNCKESNKTSQQPVCGTNNVTYANHCEYVQARCFYLERSDDRHDNHHDHYSDLHALGVQHFGACTGDVTTRAPMTQHSSSSTSPWTPPHLMYDVFCKNIEFVGCFSGFELVCGSDGQFYPNKCELRKSTCSNPTLHEVDSSKCSAGDRHE